MAKKDNNYNGNGTHTTNGNGVSLGEIGTIRNILMGEQLTEYELKFRELEEQLTSLKEELFSRVQETNKHNQNIVATVERTFDNKIDAIENKIARNNDLVKEVQKNSSNDRKLIAQLLIKLGNQLLNEEV